MNIFEAIFLIKYKGMSKINNGEITQRIQYLANINGGNLSTAAAMIHNISTLNYLL